MKEFKFYANLRPSSINPADGNYSTYMQAREEIQNMRGLFKNMNPHVEVIIRVPDPRQDWIDKWYTEARRSGVHLIFRKDVVIAHNDFGNVATAAPVHGDKYYRHTGIAVAYAKLCGEPIPDYI
jgi:hypothetical protein